MNNDPYFVSRSAVGQKLAQNVAHHRYYNTAVLALSPGAAMVAVEVAKKTYSPMGLLLTKNIMLPDDKTSFGVVSGRGDFTQNVELSRPQVEDFEMEYRNALDHNKMMAVHDLNIVGHKVMADPHFCKMRRVIIVHDMAMSATDFKAGIDFLHTIETERLILLSAIAKQEALYGMQELGDEVHVAHSTATDFPAEHYFGDNNIPDMDILLHMMEQTLA